MEKPSPDTTIIWDLVDMTEVNINHTAKIHLKTPLLRRRAADFAARSSDCELYFSGGRARGSGAPQATCVSNGSVKFGHPVVKVTIATPVPEGRSVRRNLEVIKELGWLITHREDIASDGQIGFIADLIDLCVGEPPAGDFAIPRDYPRVADFVEFAKALRTARKEPIDPNELEAMKKKWDSVIAEARASGDFRFQ